MTIASRTTTMLASNITQATLVSALLTAFSNAGYSAPVDNYTSGTDRIIVYRFDSDVSKTFGQNYLRVRITSAFQILHQILTSWNATTKTGNNGSVEVALATIATTSIINFDALNGGNEYKLVVVTQTTTSFILGIICPENKPTWWDINVWPYGFIFLSINLNSFRGSTLNPYSNSDYSSFLNSTAMGLANTQNNRRDVLTGVVILSASNRGVAAKTSDDLAIACASGSSKFDILSFPDSTAQYLVINNVSGGLAFRIQ